MTQKKPPNHVFVDRFLQGKISEKHSVEPGAALWSAGAVVGAGAGTALWTPQCGVLVLVLLCGVL